MFNFRLLGGDGDVPVRRTISKGRDLEVESSFSIFRDFAKDCW